MVDPVEEQDLFFELVLPRGDDGVEFVALTQFFEFRILEGIEAKELRIFAFDVRQVFQPGHLEIVAVQINRVAP